MKAILKHLKPYDFVLIGLAILLSFTPLIVSGLLYANQPAEPQVIAIVKIDGKEVDRFILADGAEHITKTYYPHEGQYNIVERKGKAIRVKEDNSPDQIAVMTSWILKPGQVSICLPHGLVIEILGEIPDDDLVLPL
ncbi:NusG domain II-containing protein [Aerococcaceae bacterium NML191292]|nr:NusG domain II-containing protein [Aerococcaceae bacterium NML191292]MCW6661351.1 NusG domain II-containing protein [Aerococcaceae bacterium NML201209]MCW6665644.1 NusG domain II-containing protein [Aerococcaceae bacterium NML191219]MCW6667242.1 NusG domain II-containing protein [Aerococcaceae bacterium NML190938]MCW6682133.1 NusG domain II-containing protein [Aerococcaceae bacterium NML160702]